MVVQDFEVFAASANGNLSGRSPSILLSQDRSVAQTPHWGVCCLRKRELVGAQPLHLAIARPFCRSNTPLGCLLLTQTRTCRGAAPPSCYRKTVLSLAHPTGVCIVEHHSTNAKLSNSVRCFALRHFYTLLNHTCNICNRIGAVILEPF